MKLRINAGNKDNTNPQDKAIAEAYRNKFIIPLDFEMLDSAMPYYQVGLRYRLSYELLLNDYNRVINSSKTDAAYKITYISLEYYSLLNPNSQEVSGLNMLKWCCCTTELSSISQIPVNKSDMKWNWSFNKTCKSLKGILVLFEGEKPFA